MNLNGKAPVTEEIIPERIEFVFIGRLDEEKCPSLLLKILRYILQHEDIDPEKRNNFQSNVHISMIGYGTLSTSLQFYAAQYNLTAHVSFLGKLTHPQIQHFLTSLQEQRIYPILINPRLSGETFGYVHIEALFMGLPTIAFLRGSGRESILVGDLIPFDEATEKDVMERKETESNAMQRMAEVMMNAVNDYPRKYSLQTVCGIAMSVLPQFQGNHYGSSLIEVIKYVYV
jgi:glycosyltransferase involved in cell wall biosynthesis